jgi:hypothetical protein
VVGVRKPIMGGTLEIAKCITINIVGHSFPFQCREIFDA